MSAFFDRIWVSHTRLQWIAVEHSKVDLLIKYWNGLLNKLDEKNSMEKRDLGQFEIQQVSPGQIELQLIML